jgi:hypothetical protein
MERALALDVPASSAAVAAAVAPQSAAAFAPRACPGGALPLAGLAAGPLPGLATLHQLAALLVTFCQLAWVALRAGVARAALLLLAQTARTARRAAAVRAAAATAAAELRRRAASPPSPPPRAPALARLPPAPAAAVAGPLLPPQAPAHAGRLTCVVDLDETLIAPPRPPRRVSSPADCGAPLRGAAPPSPAPAAGAVLRPGVHAFLERLAEAGELVLWTAAGPAYAARQLRALDPARRLFAGVIAGAASISAGGAKDLSRLGRDLSRVVLVDNAVAAMALQPSNGVPCPPFRGGADDKVGRGGGAGFHVPDQGAGVGRGVDSQSKRPRAGRSPGQRGLRGLRTAAAQQGGRAPPVASTPRAAEPALPLTPSSAPSPVPSCPPAAPGTLAGDAAAAAEPRGAARRRAPRARQQDSAGKVDGGAPGLAPRARRHALLTRRRPWFCPIRAFPAGGVAVLPEP